MPSAHHCCGLLALITVPMMLVEFLLLRYFPASSAATTRKAKWKPRPFHTDPSKEHINTSLLHGTLDSACQPTPDDSRRALLRWHHPEQAACSSDDAALCALAAQHSNLVLTVAAWPEQADLLRAFTFSSAALSLPTLILLAEVDAAEAATASAALSNYFVTVAALPNDRAAHGASAHGSLGSLPSQHVLSRKWAAIATLLEHIGRSHDGSVGVHGSLLYADCDAVLAHNPFTLASNDTDVEAMSEAWDEEAARGFIHGSDDPSMGWGRYAESMRV